MVFGVLIIIIGILLIYRRWQERKLLRDLENRIEAAIEIYLQRVEISNT